MSETFPRWNLSNVNFVESDPETIKSFVITTYESVSGRTLSPGDPIRLFLLSIADIMIQQQVAMNFVGQQNLITYAIDENLDALGKYMGVTRLQGTNAVTTLKFTLSQALGEDFFVPINYEVGNGTVSFTTDDELKIPAGELYGEVSATCTTSGTIGNDYVAGQINSMTNPISFLSKAENTTTTSGGSDLEDDASFADRIRLAPNSFSVAGPEKAYIYHTHNVSGSISDVSVDSPNPGEVKVYPLMENGELPSDNILNEVQEYLSSDTIRPLTDYVEVLAPVAVEYAINVDYWISKNNVGNSTQIQESVTEAVNNYKTWQQSKLGRDITPDQLIHDVMEAGASRIDFSTLSPSTWQLLEANQVAQCTGININYKGTKDE